MAAVEVGGGGSLGWFSRSRLPLLAFLSLAARGRCRRSARRRWRWKDMGVNVTAVIEAATAATIAAPKEGELPHPS